MKKYITFLIIWLFAMSGLTKIYSLDLYTFGGLSYDYSSYNSQRNDDYEWFQGNIASGASQDVLFFSFFAEAELETEMYMIEIDRFRPTHQNYYVRGGVWIGPVTIQYEHLCMHNVDCVDNNRRGGHDRVSIMFDSRK